MLPTLQSPKNVSTEKIQVCGTGTESNNEQLVKQIQFQAP